MIEKLKTPKSINWDDTPEGFIQRHRLITYAYEKINELIDAVNEIMTWRFDCDDENPAKNVQPDTEEHSEPEMPNTAYVTLTEDGCFVGGEPATQYNGEDIYRPYLCVAYFKEARDIIREEYGFELLELHCLQSSTEGEYEKTGNPIPDKDGTCAWVRAIYKNKEGKTVASRWVFYNDYGSASSCAGNCTFYCGFSVQHSEAMRVGLFGSVSQ